MTLTPFFLQCPSLAQALSHAASPQSVALLHKETVELVTHLRPGTMMTESERVERLQIMLSQEELRAVENWRFDKRMPSRAAAVRELLRRGLAAEGFDLAGEGVRSRTFGVVSTGGSDASSEDASS